MFLKISYQLVQPDKDFFEWYPNYKYYDKERELHILEHLEFIEDDWEDYLEYKSGT